MLYIKNFFERLTVSSLPKNKKVTRYFFFFFSHHILFSSKTSKKIHMPRAGIEPASSGPQPDVLPLYYRGEVTFWQ